MKITRPAYLPSFPATSPVRTAAAPAQARVTRDAYERSPQYLVLYDAMVRGDRPRVMEASGSFGAAPAVLEAEIFIPLPVTDDGGAARITDGNPYSA